MTIDMISHDGVRGIGDRRQCVAPPALRRAGVGRAHPIAEKTPLAALSLAVIDLERRRQQGETALVDALQKPVEMSGQADIQVRLYTTTTQPI